jgi:hypothetical protein
MTPLRRSCASVRATSSRTVPSRVASCSCVSASSNVVPAARGRPAALAAASRWRATRSVTSREREIRGERGDAPHPLGQRFEECERHGRPPLTQREDGGARENEELRRRRRDRRGEIATPIEERHFPQGGGRPLGVEALLAARLRRLPHVDRALNDDEEPVAGLALGEHTVTLGHGPRGATTPQCSDLRGGQGLEIRHPSEHLADGPRARPSLGPHARCMRRLGVGDVRRADFRPSAALGGHTGPLSCSDGARWLGVHAKPRGMGLRLTEQPRATPRG